MERLLDYYDLSDLISEEKYDFLKKEIEDPNEISNPVFFIEEEEPEIQVNSEEIEQKMDFSNLFNVFHFFSHKINEKDTNKEVDKCIENKTEKKSKMFLTRKKERKKMKDNIIKKIKSRFFKYIKKSLKERLLYEYNYKKSFYFLSQKFISDISKKNNANIWDENFLDFLENKLQDKNKDEILEYLKNEKIGEMTLKDIFNFFNTYKYIHLNIKNNEYLNSQQFKDSIPNAKNEKRVTDGYINDYINNR